MKKIVKVKCSGLSVIALLVSMLSVYNSDINEYNITDYLKSDCSSVSDYIMSNFSIFVSKYNESVEKDKLCASYIENRFPIIINEAGSNHDGIFLDFDADNGYAIVGDEYRFYDFKIRGASPYKNIESSSYCFSTVSGYLYDKEGEYVNVDDSKNYSISCLDDSIFGSSYRGQQKPGCGHITDTKLYVEDKYGSGWEPYKSKSILMATGVYTTQSRLSCYHTFEYKKDDLYYSSEDNCWFVSAYNILQSLASATGNYQNKVNEYKTDRTKPSMPLIGNYQTYNPKYSESFLYNKIYDNKDNNISGYITSSSGYTHYKAELVNKTFPKLYNDVRKFVVNKYRKVDYGSIYDTAHIINEVGKQYGYNFKAKGTVAAGLYGSSGITAINKDLPFGLCSSVVSNSGYGNHLMAGCGYKIYSKTTGWWIFKSTSYIYFYELRDGHYNDKIYFDLSAWTGFGGVVLLDYSIFNY